MSAKSQIKSKLRKMIKEQKYILSNIDDEKETIELIKQATEVASSLGLSFKQFDNMDIKDLLKLKNK